MAKQEQTKPQEKKVRNRRAPSKEFESEGDD
jgi:hypothetical protein